MTNSNLIKPDSSENQETLVLRNKSRNIPNESNTDLKSSFSTDLNSQSIIRCSKILEYLDENEKIKAPLKLDSDSDVENKNPDTNFISGFWGCIRPVMKYFYPEKDLSNIKSPDSWIVPFDNIKELVFIGSGSQGAVFSGYYKGEKIAIKKLNQGSLKDIKHLKNLNHPNVVQFKAACVQRPCFCLLMEYCPYGQLYQILHSGQTINPDLICTWTKQIINGMSYLHSQDIIHRDLKSPNILIGNNNLIKISDLCTSKKWNHQSARMSFAGTVAWMAPEIIRNEFCSFKVDVWSFGVVLWELLTNEVPYEGVDSTSIIWGVGSENLCLPLPMSLPTELRVLLKQCWNADPKKRPNFKEIQSHFNMASNEFLEKYSEEDFQTVKDLWTKEIALHFRYMRREGVSMPKLEAYLIKLRRNELKHAQDIRRHYDTKLSRVNQLYDELQDAIVKLNEERKNLKNLRESKSLDELKREDSQLLYCGSCGVFSMVDLSKEQKNGKNVGEQIKRTVDPGNVNRRSFIQTLHNLIHNKTNDRNENPINTSFDNVRIRDRNSIRNQANLVNNQDKFANQQFCLTNEASQNSLFTRCQEDDDAASSITVIRSKAREIVDAEELEELKDDYEIGNSEDFHDYLAAVTTTRIDQESVISASETKSTLIGEPKQSSTSPRQSCTSSVINKRLESETQHEMPIDSASESMTQSADEAMTNFESKMPIHQSLENLAKDLAAHMSDSFSEKETRINRYMFVKLQRPSDGDIRIPFELYSHDEESIPVIQLRPALPLPPPAILGKHNDDEDTNDFRYSHATTNQSVMFTSLTEADIELTDDDERNLPQHTSEGGNRKNSTLDNNNYDDTSNMRPQGDGKILINFSASHDQKNKNDEQFLLGETSLSIHHRRLCQSFEVISDIMRPNDDENAILSSNSNIAQQDNHHISSNTKKVKSQRGNVKSLLRPGRHFERSANHLAQRSPCQFQSLMNLTANSHSGHSSMINIAC